MSSVLSLHWWDAIPFIVFILLIGALILVGWSIGAGYAWMRHRQERQPERF
jgi:hypothetical protein